MSDFDPYLKWLGIRETARPINHYRLLGLDLFESDTDVISMAADRQMTHIRTYQSGPNGDMSQQILNELARARRCLLVADKKVEYDAGLRESMEPSALPAINTDINPPAIAKKAEENLANQIPSTVDQPTVVPSVAPTVVHSAEPTIGIVADVDARSKTKKRESKRFVWTLFGWLTSAVAAVGVAAWLLNSGWLPNSKPTGGDKDGKTVAAGAVPNPETEKDPPKIDGTENNRPNNQGTEKVRPKSNGTENEVAENPLLPENNPPWVTEVAANTNASNPTTVAVELVPGFKPEPKEVGFDLENLAAYPKARAEALRLIGEIKREVPEGKTIRFEPSATQGGSDDYRVVPEDGALLIGLAMTTTSDLVIKAIQPIFFDGLQAGAGPEIPSIDSETTCVIAKPGYAVGEIEISAIQPINCFRIKFMKISRTGLDRNVAYLSKWYGRETGLVRTIANERGLPIVGVYGRSDKVAGVATLGLIAMDASAKPTPKPGFFGGTSPPEAGTPDPNSGTPNVDPVVKLPQPSPRERSVAKKNLPESFQVLIANANNVRAVMQVAQQLVADASLEPDAILKYVVLEEAIRLSESVGDAETAVAALREIDRSFEIEFWKEAEKTIERAARNPQSVTAFTFKDTMDELINEAKTEGLYDEAGKLLADAIGFAKRSKDLETTNAYESLRKEIQELERLTEEGTKAAVILSASPDDPKANLDHGNYLFVLQGDIGEAAKHWKKTNDKQLVSLATSELEIDESDSAQIVQLAEKWTELGKSNRTTRDRKCLDRAYELYGQAAKSLTGLAKQSVDYKMREMREILKN